MFTLSVNYSAGRAGNDGRRQFCLLPGAARSNLDTEKGSFTIDGEREEGGGGLKEFALEVALGGRS